MGKSAAGISSKSFDKSFKGVPGGTGSFAKLGTQIQRAGLAEFMQSPQRELQLSLLRRLSTGKDFGLSTQEAGRIQEQGRTAQEAAFRQGTDQIGNLFSRGSITSGQQQALTRSALAQRSAGLADFQRREFIRQLQEARQRPLFQVQAIESLANALTGIPNFQQINELLRTRAILSNPLAQVGGPGGGGSGGGGISSLLGRAAGGALTGFGSGGGLPGALGGALGGIF